MDQKTVDKLRLELEAEHERLAAEIEEMERAGHEKLSEVSGENNYRDHMADQGTATFTRELDMTLVDNTRKSLEYGVCARCGKPISASRLEAVPAADLCISCKEWEEQS